jgi:glutathione-regulated potassium-efflux system ancillary protein KefC/glutathione-regulated potassium-efflux system protein KefB
MISLAQVAIFLLAAVIAVPISQRLGFGAVLGYLVAGMAIGPSALAVVDDADAVLHFGEYGVVMLLFLIGLELKPQRLWTLRRQVFGLGGAQVVASALVLGLVAVIAGVDPGPAALAGIGLALSSTAFVLPMLAEKGELAQPHGRAAFSVLLFQDLAVIPVMALIPLLGAAGAADAGGSALLGAVKAVAVLAGVIVGGRYILRPLFRMIAETHTHEIFVATALLVVIGVAVLMTFAGLSMSLGAFIAGMLLADSEYRHEIQADLEPFKGLLLGLFFHGGRHVGRFPRAGGRAGDHLGADTDRDGPEGGDPVRPRTCLPNADARQPGAGRLPRPGRRVRVRAVHARGRQRPHASGAG